MRLFLDIDEQFQVKKTQSLCCHTVFNTLAIDATGTIFQDCSSAIYVGYSLRVFAGQI